jgi:hypothetical protein
VRQGEITDSSKSEECQRDIHLLEAQRKNSGAPGTSLRINRKVKTGVACDILLSHARHFMCEIH